jgi:uncharacterized membrane protein YdjX (TVP38/TMEM64 family)
MFKGIIEHIRIVFNIRFILPFILFFGFILFYFFNLGSILNWDFFISNYSEIKKISSESIIYSSIIYFVVYFLVSAFSIPALLILSLLGGALFGWTAVLLIIVSGTLGCWVVFKAAKGFLHEYLSKKTNPYISSISSNFHKGSFTWLLTLKLFPFLPISFGNIVPGVLGMKSSTFLLATFLAFIPGTLIYVGFGRGIAQLIIKDEPISLSMFDNPSIYIPVTGLLIASLTSLAVKLLKIKESNY